MLKEVLTILFLAIFPTQVVGEGLPAPVIREFREHDVVLLGEIPKSGASSIQNIQVLKGDLNKVPKQLLRVTKKLQGKMPGRSVVILLFRNGDANSSTYLYASKKKEVVMSIADKAFEFRIDDIPALE